MNDFTSSDEFDGPQYCAYTTYESHGERIEVGVPQRGEGATDLERAVWDALYEVEDPEMPVSIVDLGLVYGVEVVESVVEDDGDDDGAETVARVRMTLTYTGCPARTMLQDDIREAAASPERVDRAEVELVWSPEWSVEFVSEDGRRSLREFGVAI